MDVLPKKIEGLEIREFEDAYMIHEPDRDRVHYLNHTAVLVLELCTGENSPRQIAEMLRTTYSLENFPESEVHQVLQSMSDEGLIEWLQREADRYEQEGSETHGR